LGTLQSCIEKNEEAWFEIKDPKTTSFPKKAKIINDSVYGTIKLERHLVFLIDLPCFQRLRRIRQLGFSDLVYPGAHHSRFEHSIGTAYLSERFLSNMKTNNRELEEILTTETISENQIASLYHDIGHVPFSHVTEGLLLGEKELTDICENQGLEDIKPHEIISSEFVKGKYISEAIERINSELGYNLSPISISRIILGKAPEKDKHNRFLGQLLHGAVDVDRIDYLSRDALYTGVPFGKIDLGRLLQTINVHKGYMEALDLVADYKGIQAIESLLVARTLMYSSVYHHHTSRASSSLFQRLVFHFFKEKEMHPFELCTFDDFTLLRELSSSANFCNILRDIEFRKIPKICLALRGRNLVDLISFERFTSDLFIEKSIEIESKIGEGAILDIPKYEKYDEIDMFILSEDEVKPISEFSNIAKGIEANKHFGWIGYVFSKAENREKITTSAKKFFKENQVGIKV